MHALKYVCLAPRAGGFPLIRLGLAPDTHRDIAAPLVLTHDITSAGFVEFGPEGEVRTFGLSDSLRAEPAPADAAMIAGMARATHRLSSVL